MGRVLRHESEADFLPSVHQPPPSATISVDDQALTDLGHQPHANIPAPKISCHVCRHALSCSTDQYEVISFWYATRALPTNENLLWYHFPGLFWQTLNSSSVLDVKQTSFVKLQQFPITIPEANVPHSNIIRIVAQRAEYLKLTVDQQAWYQNLESQIFNYSLHSDSKASLNAMYHINWTFQKFSRLTNVHHSAGALVNAEHLLVSLMSANAEYLNVIILFS